MTILIESAASPGYLADGSALVNFRLQLPIHLPDGGVYVAALDRVAHGTAKL